MGKICTTSLILLIQKADENDLYFIIMQCKDFIFEKENISLNAKLKLKTPTYHHEQERRIL